MLTILNSCDELLVHLYDAYGTCQYAYDGYLEFQGDLYEIGGIAPDPKGIFMPSPKFPKTVFSIQEAENDSAIILCIFKGDAFILDQTLGVKLPRYIRDELTATIQGYY